MKILPKILTDTWWGNILLGFLAAVVFYYIILSTVLSSNTPVVAVVSDSMKHVNPEVTHYKWLEENLEYNRTFVDSWSVSKGFSTGDMPVVRGSEKYEIGNVIVYSVNGINAPIIHRIIKINDDGTYQTKGDNNAGQLQYEYRVTTEQIKGKVIFIIPKVGYFKVLINRLLGV